MANQRDRSGVEYDSQWQCELSSCDSALQEPSESVPVRVRRVFAEFQSLEWHKYVPRVVSVPFHRGHSKVVVCHALSNSPAGRQCLYLALLSAISNNDGRHFNWLLRETMDVLSRDEIKSAPEMWYAMQEDINIAPFRRIKAFCSSSLFNKSDMIVSLLHYAVLCCSTEIVADLIAKVQDVSKSSEEWYPFLPQRFSCTPLWLAAFQKQPNIMRLLLTAGASPYESCVVAWHYWHFPDPEFCHTVLAMCKNHPQTRNVLQSCSIRSLRFPVPLSVVTQMLEGSDWVVQFLKSTFRWNSDAPGERYKVRLMALQSKGWEFLELPCHSEEDIVHKQIVCIRLLVYAVLYLGNYFFMERHQLAATVRNLVRHGANACGFTTLASRAFIARYRKMGPGQNISETSTQQRQRTSVLSKNIFPEMLARCSRSHYQLSSGSSHECCYMEYPPDSTMTSHMTFGMSYFWINLYVTKSLDSAVGHELFHCGALTHVNSLKSVPFSTSDGKLHNGPTCRCEGVQLSAQQRKMSITDLLLPPNIVPSLQASCRTAIIHSCQSHGVVPAIRKLPLPSKAIDYLLFNFSRDNLLFRH